MTGTRRGSSRTVRGALRRTGARLARAALVASVLIAASRVGAQEPIPASTDALGPALAEARALVDRGRPREAVAKLEALPPSPDPRVPYLRGVALYHADDFAGAIEALQPLVNKFPPDSIERRETEQVLGLSLHLAGRFPEAIPYLERTQVWATGNLELHFTLGVAYIQTQQPAKARVALAKAFGVAPESAGAHVVAAQTMVRLEMETQAEAELRQALEKNPAIPQANYLLGQQAIFRGRLDEGIALTRREIEINPGNAMAFYQLGDAYSRQNRWEESIASLQQSLWLNPFYSGPYILLGRAYLKKGQLPMAQSMLGRAVDYDPNNRVAHYLLGQVLQQLGRADEAAREFAIAEKLQEKR